MAVPFRRTSKMIKRKRRTHKKLSIPNVYKDIDGNYKMNHLMDKDSGTYKKRQVIEIKE